MRSFDEVTSWIALSLINGLGSGLIRRLILKFEKPANIFSSTFDSLTSLKGITENLAVKILNQEFNRDPDVVMEMVRESKARVITWNDDEYPALLREIHYPPAVLFAKGISVPNVPCIAIVGSRNASDYGLKAAYALAEGLASNNICVISGLAAGIDAAAHRGALSAKGITIGVLGTGIDVIYPAFNKKLFERIESEGLLLTEFLPGSKPEARNFPIRNRIISGLSLGIVVVEATKKSGSLITVDHALEQSRDVFAVPGNINSSTSTGTHRLIKQGAKLVERVEDILEEYNIKQIAKDKYEKSQLINNEVSNLIPQDEMYILTLLQKNPMHMDEIVRKSGRDVGIVASLLLNLELIGAIKQLPGKIFMRN